MGDHGLRFGKIRTTRQGEIEDNNPALVMALPERLRSNKELMANLNANSKELVTHYDTYATLLNIATVGLAKTENYPLLSVTNFVLVIVLRCSNVAFVFNAKCAYHNRTGSLLIKFVSSS